MGSMQPAPPVTARELEAAIANDELTLYFQPRVNLLSGQVVGSEALVRWPGRNQVLTPDAFLPMAEETGLLPELTLRLLEYLARACEQLRDDAAREASHADQDAVRERHDRRGSALPVSMNVSPAELESGLVSQRIGELLDSGRIGNRDIQIEVTEAEIMSHIDKVQYDLQQLTDMGLRLQMDDFGTGYSSIDRLSQLPFDFLKLDKGVVKRMSVSRQSLDVVRSSISMARELGMVSVAEGVESAVTSELLTTNGCEEAQGYFFAHPMSLDDLRDFCAAATPLGGSQIGLLHQAALDLLRYRKTLVDALYLSSDELSPSLRGVIERRCHQDVADSRIGHWYFGVGQRLAAAPLFRDIEPPLRHMHAAGIELGGLLLEKRRRRDVDELERQLVCFDHQASAVLGHLHALERELLMERLRQPVN